MALLLGKRRLQGNSGREWRSEEQLDTSSRRLLAISMGDLQKDTSRRFSADRRRVKLRYLTEDATEQPVTYGRLVSRDLEAAQAPPRHA